MNPNNPAKSDNESLNTKEFYNAICRMQAQEAGFIETRVTWLLTIEAFLFTAAAFLMGADALRWPTLQSPITYGICILGMFIAWITIIGVNRARSARASYRKQWEDRMAKDALRPAEWPDPFGASGKQMAEFSPHKLIPKIFFTIWILIIAIVFSQDNPSVIADIVGHLPHL